MKLPKQVLVTGADGALGGAVAERFLAAGCEVTGTFFLKPGALQTSNGKITWLQVDLSNSEAVREKVSPLKIDALVHCAGGFRFSASDQISDQDLDFLLDSNLRSAFLLVRHVLPGMKERNFGRVVWVSARATLNAAYGMAAYAASKAGLNMLTSSLADEVRSLDINVNAVLPTVLDTPANRRDMAQADFSTWVPVTDLAEIIFSLTQPWGKCIHGALLPVSGRL